MVTVQVGTDELTRQVDVPGNSSLLSVCAQHRLPITFGCRRGECGACLIRVHDNPSHLHAPDVRERHVLDVLRAEPGWRLACQCVIANDVRISQV